MKCKIDNKGGMPPFILNATAACKNASVRIII